MSSWMSGRRESSIIFFMSSGEISISTLSFEDTSTLLASRIARKRGALPRMYLSSTTFRMPITVARSPGLTLSTRSSVSMTSMDLGSCPAGSSSGFSWRTNFCQSMNSDFSRRSSKSPLLRPSAAHRGHSSGFSILFPVWGMGISSPHILHLNTAVSSFCLTGEILVTIPSRDTSLFRWTALIFRRGMCMSSGSPRMRAKTRFTCSAYCGSSDFRTSLTASDAAARTSSLFSISRLASSVSNDSRSEKSIVTEIFFSTLIEAIFSRYLYFPGASSKVLRNSTSLSTTLSALRLIFAGALPAPSTSCTSIFSHPLLGILLGLGTTCLGSCREMCRAAFPPASFFSGGLGLLGGMLRRSSLFSSF